MSKKHLHVPALLFFMLTIAFYSFGQQRYLDEVFTDVTVDYNVQYGHNYTSLYGGLARDSALRMDVYQPANDTVICRPVIVFLHTGSFLPPPINGGCTGTRKDSSVVEICTRFAKRGYVAAAISYRLGWNAVSTDQDVRTSTLLQAVYRAIGDARTAVRHFRDDATRFGRWNCDPDKIIVGGQGSGGYVALAYASLDKPEELLLDKFQDANTGEPYVDTLVYGNLDGFGGLVEDTIFRSHPTIYNNDTIFNDTILPGTPWGNLQYFNVENYKGVSSDVQMVFNLGGAMGDSSWLEAGEPPIVAFHVPSDPFAPYTFGAVIVPTTGDFVVEVSGSHDVVRRANMLGNNDIFINANFNDAYTQRANQVNQGFEGLFPFELPGQQAAPWEWWDTACVKHESSLTTNPDMSKTKGMTYIDTVMGYLVPRAYTVLTPIGTCSYTGISEADAQSITVFPNPTKGTFTVGGTQSGNNIQNIRMFDITGRVLINLGKLNVSQYTIDGSKYPSGIYFLEVELTKGSLTTKIVIE